MNHDRFAWLFSCSTSPETVHLVEDEAANLVDFLIGSWQVLPLTLAKLASSSLEPLMRAHWSRLSARRSAVVSLGKVQVAAICEIADKLIVEQVPFVLLKGTASRFMLYESPTDRGGNDLDIGVALNDVQRARKALEELGYVAAQWDSRQETYETADPDFRALVEARHHELGFLVRRLLLTGIPDLLAREVHAQLRERPQAWFADQGALGCFVVADIHHGLSLEIPVDALIATSTQVTYKSHRLPVPSRAHLLLHLVYKVYWEGVHEYVQGMYQYADITRLILAMDERDAAEFAEAIEKFNLRAAAYYVLRRLPGLLSHQHPRWVTELINRFRALDTRFSPAAQNDRGDMWPNLWGQRASGLDSLDGTALQ